MTLIANVKLTLSNRLAVAKAIPEVAPVMTATFPSSFFGISVLLRSHRPGFGKYRN
jgi:hypothetical protein